METAQKIFKKYFIPHVDNDHQPHLLRPRTVWFVLMVVIAAQAAFLFGSTYLAPHSRLFGEILVNALVDETNQSRTVNNLPALKDNALLQAAAQDKANDMVANGYFAHTSPAGVTPWYWFEHVGYGFSYAGENLAVNFVNSEDVTNAWMNSPGHRANILNGDFTEIGMATAQGMYQGRSAIFVVELFGAPAAQPIAFVNAAAAAESPAAKPVVVPPAPVATAPAPAPTPKPVTKPIAKPTPTVPTPSVVTVVASTSLTETSSQQIFVAVKGAETSNVSSSVPASVSTQPATVSANGTPSLMPVVQQESSVFQALFANPAAVANYFYLLLMIIFAITIGMHVFVKMEFHHPKLIFSGLLVIIVTGVFILLNQHPGLFSATIL